MQDQPLFSKNKTHRCRRWAETKKILLINKIPSFLIPSVAPSKPECRILGTAEYGQTINLTCFSHEGSPKPRYTWQSFNVQNEPRVLQTTEGMGNSKISSF